MITAANDFSDYLFTSMNLSSRIGKNGNIVINNQLIKKDILIENNIIRLCVVYSNVEYRGIIITNSHTNVKFLCKSSKNDGYIYFRQRNSRILISGGYNIYATQGTSNFLNEANVPNTVVYQPSEQGTPQAIDLMRDGTIEFVVSVPKDIITDPQHDVCYHVRRAAIDLNVPLLTNARLASAFINAFCTIDIDQLAIQSWDEYK